MRRVTFQKGKRDRDEQPAALAEAAPAIKITRVEPSYDDLTREEILSLKPTHNYKERDRSVDILGKSEYLKLYEEQDIMGHWSCVDRSNKPCMHLGPERSYHSRRSNKPTLIQEGS